MKNAILIFILFIASFAVKAQITYNETKAETLQEEKELNIRRQKIHDNRIHSSKIYRYKTKNGVTDTHGILSEEYAYDDQGNLIDFKWANKKGKMKYHYAYKYDAQNRFIEFNSFKYNGPSEYKTIYAYDNAGNNTDIRAYWKGAGNVCWHSVSKFDDKQNILELKYFTKNDTKQGIKYEYTYYPDGSKKQTTEYNRKGKVQHIWNYDCNPAGTLVGKSLKDSSKICIRYEKDKNGNQIKIKDENVKEGSIVRTVTKYDKNENMLERMEYNKNSVMKFHSTGSFDNMNNMTERIVYNCKDNSIKEHSIIHYDTSGNITELIAYKKAPTPDHIMKYDYVKD